MIPNFIGEHLSFNYPLLPGEQYENYYIEFEKKNPDFLISQRMWPLLSLENPTLRLIQ